MNRLFTVMFLMLFLSGCFRNAQLKAVLNDLETTPRCNTNPVYTHPKDTKETLSAKLLIANDRVAGCGDWYYYFDKKIKSYRKF